jgi:hypothetical protein
MGSTMALLRFALILLVATQASAASFRYLARDELLCEPAKTTCIRATLTYEKNDRLLRLRGRVDSTTGPGRVQITLTGTTRQGYRRYAPMEFLIRGRASEIVDFKMIPDHPDVEDWVIFGVAFAAEAAE